MKLKIWLVNLSFKYQVYNTVFNNNQIPNGEQIMYTFE